MVERSPDDGADRPPRRALFTDERGAGLRVTRHAERGLVVLSVWHGSTCTATFRMTAADAGRLACFLVRHLVHGSGHELATASGRAGTSP